MNHQTIIVLDFGSQYTQLIARRLRELSVYSEIWPPDSPAERIRDRQPAGIILSGGPKSVSDPGAPLCDPAVFDLGRPVLGICYGMQLMAHTLGGTGRAGAAARVWACRRQGRLARRVGRALRGSAARDSCVGEPRRFRRLRARRASRWWPRARTLRSRRWPIPRGSCTRCSFIPKSSTPRAAWRSCATSPTASAAARAIGRCRRLSRRRRPRFARRLERAASSAR